MSVFVDKVFESLTLDITFIHNNAMKQCTVTNIYRSPTIAAGWPANEQVDSFHEKFKDILNKLSNHKSDAYVFLDSNINLFNVESNIHANSYLSNITTSGFILTNFRATRIQSDTASLIDHILTNSKDTNIVSGTIVDDLSDHFMTFILPNLSRHKSKPRIIKRRHYTKTNIDSFKQDLQQTNWDQVTLTNDVNSCYDEVWKIYSNLHDLHFPLTSSRFNKRIHKISNFMTTGLLISRTNKQRLHKIALTDNVPFNWQQYRTYRNIFNKTVKQSKKLHYLSSIEKNVKNPKKTWDILRELTTGNKTQQSIDKISTDGVTLSDPTQIANEFNKFFTRVGRDIANSVEPTSREPSDYLPTPLTAPPSLRAWQYISTPSSRHYLCNGFKI